MAMLDKGDLSKHKVPTLPVLYVYGTDSMVPTLWYKLWTNLKTSHRLHDAIHLENMILSNLISSVLISSFKWYLVKITQGMWVSGNDESLQIC